MVLASLLCASFLVYAVSQNGRDTFDCPMRKYALQFSADIQPFRSAQVFQDIADALNGNPEKTSGCTITLDGANVSQAIDASTNSKPAGASGRFVYSPLPPVGGDGSSFYVDAVNGNDANNGTITQPFKTIAAALGATRAAAGPGGDFIILRAGTYYQAATLVLGVGDSGLTFQAYPGEEVWISGGAPLTGVTWEAYKVNATTAWPVFNNTNAIFASQNAPGVYLNGTYGTYQECLSACQATVASGSACNAWTWHDSNVPMPYTHQCYFRSDDVWNPTPEADHISGYNAPGPNIWVADLSSTPFTAPSSPGVPGLRFNGDRMIRARYPNSNPELGFGGVFYADWTPQQSPRLPDIQIDLPTPVRNTSVSMFQTFTAGIGGTCDRFQPNAGYWCSTHVEGGGSVIYFVPIAMNANQSILPHTPYANATGAIIQTWRPGHWASWMFEVGSSTYDAATGLTNFTFSRGGFQGSRGDDAGADSYIENVFEELDYPAEWYYDTVAQKLYYWHNATAGTPPPTDGSIVVTQLRHLFNITGTQAAPVTGITFAGIGFRDTAYTYMDPHGIPSGGDWTLERSATIFVEGTEFTTITGCVFERLDSNAILLSAYNRNATISYNEFVWLGATALAMWGNTDGGDPRLPEGYGNDGSAGNQPRGTIFEYNLCHEYGIWEKQSSCVTQFKSGQNILRYNLMYNGPRAHINHDDGFLGGAQIYSNLLMGACRESGDHGPFNSWDRISLIWEGPDGQPTFIRSPDQIFRNFIIANYNSLGAIDNDDGSSMYTTFSNFFVYGGGGTKSDFEGHDQIWHSNVVAYTGAHAMHNGYGGIIGSPGQSPYALPGRQAQHYNNIDIISSDGEYALPVCAPTVPSSILYNNSVYSPTGNISECGVSLAAWQALGHDQGTTAAPYPPAQDIIAWAKAALTGVPSQA